MGTLRDELTKVMDAATGGGEEAAGEVEAPEAAEVPAEAAPEASAESVIETEPAGETAEQKAQRARDEASGRFIKERRQREAPKAKPAVGAPPPPAVAKAGAAGVPVLEPAGKGPAGGASSAPAAPAVPEAKAPGSWKPDAREKWASLPAEVKREVLRVDAEVQKVQREYTGHRQLAEGFQRVAQPYAQMFAASGAHPVAVAGDLFRQLAVLRTGTHAEKASLVASIINWSGLLSDGGDGLAAALKGAPAAQGAPQQPQKPALDEASLDRLLEQREQRREAQRLAQEAETFLSKQEFGDHLSKRVGVILQVEAELGNALTLQEAYDRACQEDAHTRSVLDQRKAAEAVKAKQASTLRARAAASSVRSAPTGGSSPKSGNGTLRGAIEEAWEKHAAE